MAIKQVRFKTLSPQWQELIKRMQRLNFGYLENLRVVDGEPELHEDFKSAATYRFPGEKSLRPEFCLDDFVLQDEVNSFIETLEEMYCRRIAKIEIRHGLPFKMEVEDPE